MVANPDDRLNGNYQDRLAYFRNVDSEKEDMIAVRVILVALYSHLLIHIYSRSLLRILRRRRSIVGKLRENLRTRKIVLLKTVWKGPIHYRYASPPMANGSLTDIATLLAE